MTFHKDMLVSENIKDLENIKAILKDHTAVFGIYLVCTSKKETVIVSSGEYFKLKGNWIIIGMAESRKKCFELVRNIVERLYKSRKSLNIYKEYTK